MKKCLAVLLLLLTAGCAGTRGRVSEPSVPEPLRSEIVASIVATAVASVAVGGWVSRSSGRPIVPGALRQLAIVAVVAAVTYTIGTVFGTAVA